MTEIHRNRLRGISTLYISSCNPFIHFRVISLATVRHVLDRYHGITPVYVDNCPVSEEKFWFNHSENKVTLNQSNDLAYGNRGHWPSDQLMAFLTSGFHKV